MVAEAAAEAVVVAGVEVAIVVQVIVTVLHPAAQAIPRKATATTHHLDLLITTM